MGVQINTVEQWNKRRTCSRNITELEKLAGEVAKRPSATFKNRRHVTTISQIPRVSGLWGETRWKPLFNQNWSLDCVSTTRLISKKSVHPKWHFLASEWHQIMCDHVYVTSDEHHLCGEVDWQLFKWTGGFNQFLTFETTQTCCIKMCCFTK